MDRKIYCNIDTEVWESDGEAFIIENDAIEYKQYF